MSTRDTRPEFTGRGEEGEGGRRRRRRRGGGGRGSLWGGGS